MNFWNYSLVLKIINVKNLLHHNVNLYVLMLNVIHVVFFQVIFIIWIEHCRPPPQCRTLHLNKGPEGLGFSIVGGHGSPHGDLPIYVKSVFSKGAAADEGSLKRGDQIISVNGQSLEGCTHDEAVAILKNTRGAVTMTVLTS